MGSLAMGIASFAMGAVQSIAQYKAQKDEAKANEKNTIQAWVNSQTELTRRRMQEQDALRQKQRQNDLAEAEASSEVAVAGAANGVSGITMDNLLADVTRRSAYNKQIEEENTKNIMQQLTIQSKGINAQAQGRLNSVPRPSPLSLIAGIGNSALSAMTGYKKATSPLGAT